MPDLPEMTLEFTTIETKELARMKAENTALKAKLANIQVGVIDIIHRALAGYMDDYKTVDGYVKWGLVTKDIAALFKPEPTEL